MTPITDGGLQRAVDHLRTTAGLILLFHVELGQSYHTLSVKNDPPIRVVYARCNRPDDIGQLRWIDIIVQQEDRGDRR